MSAHLEYGLFQERFWLPYRQVLVRDVELPWVGNIPVAYTDPFGLSPCSDLRDDIDRNSEDLEGRIDRYLDAYSRGEADTGHRIQIQQRVNTVNRLQRNYRRNCRGKDDDDHNWPGSGAAAEQVRRVSLLPVPQLDQSSGWRPREFRIPAPTPQQTAVGLSGILLLIGMIVLAPVGL